MPGFLESLFDPNELYNALKERNLLPEWATTLPYGAEGEYYPASNRLVANYPDNPTRRNVVAHEMTHAVQNNLLDPMALHIQDKKWNKDNVPPEADQYLNAIQKLRAAQYGRVGQYDRRQAEDSVASLEQLMNGLYKNPNAEPRFDAYRKSVKEAQAFGVGGMTQGGNPNEDRVGNHLDPTMATELAILMDLYKRMPSDLQRGAALRRQADIDVGRNQASSKQVVQDYFNTFMKDYQNPFVERNPKRK